MSSFQLVIRSLQFCTPAALAGACGVSLKSRTKSGRVDYQTPTLSVVMEYNKAIQYLKEHTVKNGGSKSLAVSLIACVLFITLEPFTGRIGKATIHLNEGRKLLLLWIQNVSSTTDSPGRESRKLNFVSKPQSVEDELVSIFAHLDLQSTYFGSGKPQVKLAVDSSTASAKDTYPNPLGSFGLPTEFYFIHEANQCLLIITNECLHFTGQNIDQAQHTLQNQHSSFHRQYLCACLRKWRQAYERFHQKINPSESSDWMRKRQSALMLMQHSWLCVILPTFYIDVEETDFDFYVPEFATIVDLASTSLPKEGVQSKAFSLLRRAGREGLCYSILMIQLGREAIMLEEGTAPFDLSYPLDGEHSNKQVDLSALIPLQCRVCAATVSFADEDHSALQMTFLRKQRDFEGRFTGFEQIVRSQPLEGWRYTADV